MHACYYGASVLTCLVSFTTFLSYFEGKILYISFFLSYSRNLPGVAVIKQTFYHAIPVILFYTFFLVHILSFLLRILLNYYHISINDFLYASTTTIKCIIFTTKLTKIPVLKIINVCFLQI